MKELLDLRPPLDGLGNACSRKEAMGIAKDWCREDGHPGVITVESWVSEENVLLPPSGIAETTLERCWVAHLTGRSAASDFDERLEWYVAKMSGRGRLRRPFLLIAKEGGAILGGWE